MKIERFEDVQSWQAGRELARLVYDATREPAFARDFGLRDQIQRAAGSVMHNVAEGFESGTDAEFARYLKIARRSASEVQSQTYLALDLEYVDKGRLDAIYAKANDAKRLINALIGYLNRSRQAALKGTT